MDGKKLITIVQFGGEFESNKDGTLSYHGGEAHAIDVDHETQFEGFKAEIAEMVNCSSDSLYLKYFLPGNNKTPITISNDKDFTRMMCFNVDSSMVYIYVSSGEIVAHDVSSIMPAGSRSSRTSLSEAVVPVDVDIDVTPLDFQHGDIVDDDDDDAPMDIPVNSAPQIMDNAPVSAPARELVTVHMPAVLAREPALPMVPLATPDPKHIKVPSSWETAITGVSQRFTSVNEFREALRKYGIAHSFAYKFQKNDSHRVTATCKTEGCPWRIHASRLSTTNLFCIKKLNPTHTCEGAVLTSGSNATIYWVAGIVKEKLQDAPNYKPKDIVNDIKQEYGVELNYYQAWRGKEVAREQLRGSYKEAYSQLPSLCEKIMETNPGSFATFGTKDDSSFHRLFISFHASLHGFQSGCRPLLSLDRLPLRSKYQETLLVATAVDGDDGVFPVAFAIVDDETVDNWRWFLVQLKSAVSTSSPITFVADTEKGLKELIGEVFENDFHSYCLRYLSEKFKKDLPTHFSNEVKRMLVADFYAAAYALKPEEYKRSTESIKGISLEAFNWVENSEPEHWANSFFQGARYNHMTTNFGELFRNWVPEVHEFPITQMVHTIRCKMMELMYTRSKESSEWLTRLTPSMEEKLKNEILKAQSLEPELMIIPSTDNIDICSSSLEKFDMDQGINSCNVWQISGGGSVELVDINKGICSCKVWQITGLPCFHAIAVFKCTQRSPYEYCSRYFTTESYRLAYSKSISPVTDVDTPMKKESSQVAVVVTPPPTRRAPGRPKATPKKRKSSEGLDKRKFECSKCKGSGHNKSTCKEAVQGC